jgi:PAS domain S-box-containing protein
MQKEPTTVRQTTTDEFALKQLIDATPVGIVVFDHEERVIYANPLAVQLFGKSVKASDALKCGDFIGCLHRHSDTRGCGHTRHCPVCHLFISIQATLKATPEATFTEGETLLERDRGVDAIWVKYKVNRIKMNDRDVAVMAMDDITAQKRTERLLRESEARFQNMFERAPAGYQSLDMNGCFIEVNEAWLTTLGYRREEVIGRWFGEFLAPGFVDIFRERFAIFKASGKINSEFEMLHKDGSSRFFAFEGRIGYKEDGNFEKTHCILHDVTERKQIEAEGKDQARLIATLLDSIPDIIFFKDVNGVYQACNSAFAHHVGRPRKEIIRKTDYDLYSKSVADLFREHDRRLLQEKSGHRNEEWISYPDGHKVLVDTMKIPYRDAHGNIIGILGVSRDITDRKRTEQALLASEERFRQITENMADVVWLRSFENSRMLYVSPSYERIWGRSCQSLYENPEEFMEAVHPVDQEAVFAAYKQYAETGHFDMMYRIIRPDGEMRWIHARTYPILNETGQVIRYAGIATDITARRQAEDLLRKSEEKYRKIYENSLVGIFHSTPAGRFTEVNPAFAKMLGYESPETLLDGIADIATQYYADPEDRRTFERILKAQGSIENFEFRVKHKDGSRRWISNSTRAYFGEEGSIDHYEGVGIDITKRKQAEAELMRAHELLEIRANQLRALAAELTTAEQRERKRVSKILHDGLQQNLVIARLQVEGILSQIDDPQFRQEEQEINQLLTESIEMSRSLSTDLSPPVLYERGLAAGLEWLIRRMRDQYGLDVDLRIENRVKLPDHIKILIFESVRELLFNTIKHAGVLQAQVAMRHSDESGLRITVRDAGAGFDPCRLKPAGDEGGGFGLFSIGERIGLLGGSFEIDSTPGKGSHFRLTVPFCQAPATSVGDNLAVQSADLHDMETILKHRTSCISVLVADDHALFRDGVARLVSKVPDIRSVGQAANGREAVELARKLKPDVILMDINMPELSGVEATRAIHEELPGIRIIGLSMHDDPQFAQSMFEAGAVDYKNKGCAAAELVSAIRECMQTEKIDEG